MIRKGAPKPDVSTTEAFKRMLLEAKSIGFAAKVLSLLKAIVAPEHAPTLRAIGLEPLA